MCPALLNILSNGTLVPHIHEKFKGLNISLFNCNTEKCK